MAKRKKSRQRSVFPGLVPAIDLALGGYNKLIGPDFILEAIDPYNANIGHLDPNDLRTYDQDYVNSLIEMKPDIKLALPFDLKSISDHYVKQRILLSNYHNKAEALIIKYDIAAAKELKNFDEYTNKVVIRNEAELVALYDYIALYRKIENKRTIVHWRFQNLEIINSDNQKVVNALENSNFAILRLDEDLEHGAIRATNIITKQELILIDKALNASKKEGCFFICSLLNMDNYSMTSGGGIPIDPTSPAGKSTLTLSKKHLDNLRNAKSLNNNVMKCVREIYGFCLRGGALSNMTVSQVN